jgi:VWFA-related protein
MPRLDTTHPRSRRRFAAILVLGLALGVAVSSGGDVRAQQSAPAPKQQDRIIADVNLVVLHAVVIDDRGRFVPDLKAEHFRVLEDRVEQKLSLFKREDIPVTVGLVIDNSGSMRDKRERVNTAALTFVKSSNPEDEAFVVNFNDEYYLDLDKNFTNDVGELKDALERIDSRGSTALYDAIIGSLDHVKKGTRDKKVLLVITDGEDNTSRANLEKTMLEAQRSEAVIYGVGLLGKDKKAKNAKRALQAIAQATGGLSFFPEELGDVEAICAQIAHDIRNQYTLAYYPTNPRKDGTFRNVQVEVIPPRGRGKLTVRTRTGYYAQRTSSGND